LALTNEATCLAGRNWLKEVAAEGALTSIFLTSPAHPAIVEFCFVKNKKRFDSIGVL
jgi:hypothetical protein